MTFIATYGLFDLASVLLLLAAFSLLARILVHLVDREGFREAQRITEEQGGTWSLPDDLQ